MSLTIQIAEHPNGVCQFSFAGKILATEDMAEVNEHLDRQLEESSFKGVIVDLSKLTHMNSTGINLLIRLLTKLRNKGKELVLASLSPSVEKLVTMTKLNSIFTICATPEEALIKLNAQEA